MRLLYSEFLKVRTAPRTTLGLLIGLLALVGLGSGATASSASGPFADEIAVWDVLSVASISSIFTLILGILIVTWEYRHGTITQTFLASPRRERVIGAKLAVSLGSGAILAALSVVVALAVALFWFSPDLNQGHLETMGRIVLGAALWGMLGAGLGALIQSQVGAIVASFVWFLVAEPLIGFQLETIGDYLPGNALDRLQNTGAVEVGSDGSIPYYRYSLWVAALLATGYTLGFAVLGMASALRRDVP